MESNESKEIKKRAWESWRRKVIGRRNKRLPRRNTKDRNISKALRQLVLDRESYTCQYCGAKANPANYDLNNWRGIDWVKYDAKDTVLEIDHVIPYSKGGKTVANNLIVSCHACNQNKKHKPLKEWKI